MKTKIFLFVFAFIFINGKSFAQVLKESDIPSAALSSFKAQYYDAEKTNWKKNKLFFEAEFIMDEVKTLADYNEDGEWVQTRTPVDEKEIPGPIATYVKANFKTERMHTMEYTEKPNKEIFYYIVVRNDGLNQPNIELFFTKAGKFIKRVDPVEQKVNKDIAADNKAPKDTVKTVIAKDDDIKNKDVVTTTKDNVPNDDNDVKTVKKSGDTIARYKVSEKELPGPIMMYVKKNFKDEKIKLAEIQEKDNGSKSYYLEIKKDGYKQPMTQLYFNLDGKILRRVDPVLQKVDKDIDEMSNPDNDMTNNDFVEETVPWKELPTPITSYITKNYKGFKMKEALITKKNEIKLYQLTLKKEGTNKDTMLYFDLNGKYLKPEDLE
jgi:hypothetical protein